MSLNPIPQDPESTRHAELTARPLPHRGHLMRAPTELEVLRVDSSADLNLKTLLRIIRKRRWLILGIVFIATTLATIETFRTKPLYQAATTIELIPNDNAVRIGSSEVFLQQDEDLSLTMNTHQIVLKSSPLLEDVAVQLRLAENPVFWDVTQSKSFMDSLNDIAGKLQNSGTPAPPKEFSGTAVKAEISANRSAEETERLAPIVGVLGGALTVKQIPETRAMTIAYQHTDPKLAADIANAIAARFLETSFNKKIEGITSASDWLDKSTRELKAKVERSEQALADYSKKKSIYASAGKDSLITEKLTRLHDQASRAETNRILKQSLYDQVLEGRLQKIPEAFADPRTAELQKKLGELEIAAAELKAIYGPKYDKLAEINSQMSVLRDQIKASGGLLEERLRADYDRAVEDEKALNAALDRAKTEATKENQEAIQYSLIKQDVDTAKSLYTEFLQKASQAGLQVAQQHSNIHVVAPARTPKSRISPNRQRDILLGFLVGLFGAVVLACVMDRLDDTIRTIEDVTRATQLPTLAMIPSIRAANTRQIGGKRREVKSAEVLSLGPRARSEPEIRRARLMEFDGKSPVAEAYRAMRTGLLLSTPGNPPKTIVVTSVRMGDGKTTTAINTAISLAQLGASVVLVDCDLRKPSVHGLYGLSQSPGLSTYITGNGSIDEMIQRVSITQGAAIDTLLQVIPSGPIPPNPSELLSSEKMKHLVAELAQRFDHVVLDSPPLGSVTDATVLSTFVDGVVLVVHGGRNSRHAVQRGCQELAAVGAKVFGIVLNQVDLRREGYDDYYYYSRAYTYDQPKT